MRMRRLPVRGWGGRVEAGTTARMQIAHCDQTVVRLNHREAADFVDFGKLADRWQLDAGSQVTIVDLTFDAGDNLIAKGLARVVADGKGQHGEFPLANWPGRLTSTVTLS